MLRKKLNIVRKTIFQIIINKAIKFKNNYEI